MKKQFSRIVALILAFVIVASMASVTTFAAQIDYDETIGTYYNIISKDDYDIAPGIVESEMVMNNDDGSRRQVLHIIEADISNPYVTVIPSSKGMVPTPGQYGVQVMSEQAAWAEANGYGNVVAAMNISLSWYDSAYYSEHPELIGEPLGYLVLNGEYFENSRGKTSGAQTCLVINFDEKDGVARPADIPKTQIRSTSEPITGWEEQVIPANFSFLVKNGKNVATSETHTGGAPRSMLGIKADGTIVMVMNDGRLSPYSEGLTEYEMGEVMLSLGCQYAINGDGGGSSTFLSQRPGEELELHSSPSDGAERATTHGVLVISSAPATGEFVRATISSANDYYTPGSEVQFNAVGSDLVGTPAEVPTDVSWQLADNSFGTINENGLFVSNGKAGDVTVQLVWNDAVVGSDTIHVVIPDTLSLGQATITAPYGRDIQLAVTATYDSKNVVLKDGDISLTLSDAKMGTLNGNIFTSTTDTTVKSGAITVSFAGTELSITVDVIFGKGSEVIFDFDNQDATDDWKDLNTEGVFAEIGYATDDNGQVRFGNGALAVTTDYTQSNSMGGWIYAGLNITQKEDIVIPADAISWGMWVYIPEEAVGGEIDFRPLHLSGGKYSRLDLVTYENGYATTFDESGWHYVSVDISSYGELIIPGANNSYQSKAFIEIYNPDGSNSANNYNANEYKSINGRFTYYFDDMTIDFSSAVDDREEPDFSSLTVTYGDLDEGVAVNGQTITENAVIFNAKAVENTKKANYTGLDYASAKAYVDGVDVTSKLSVLPDGSLALAEMTLADGVHTVKFSIKDNAGNSTSIIRQINVAAKSDISTVKVVPKDSTLDKILIGSLYYMDVVATDVEKVDEVVVKIDINNSSEWQPLGLEVADGFKATCTVDPIDEIATIVIIKTGKVSATGEAVLASIPARTMEYTRTSYNPSLTPQAIWKSQNVWALDMQFTVKFGQLTQLDGTVSSFSAKKHYVDTENYLGRNTATAAYWTSKECFHIHSAEATKDADATCTKNGYSGRTFCEGCNSVVDWGTIIPATGHNYTVVDGLLKCTNSCGELFTGEFDGKTYVDGVVLHGWVDDTYYYLDGVKLTGANVIDKVVYTFDENGVYLADKGYTGFIETPDGLMYFNAKDYYATGCLYLASKQYYFDMDGIARDGEYTINGDVCNFEDGLFIGSANKDVVFAGWAGDDITFILYANGSFVLNGSGAMTEYRYTTNVPWKDYQDKIKSVFVGKDITNIAKHAFNYAYSLASLTFEEGSKVETIGANAFLFAQRLTEVVLPETVKSISVQAFAYNAKLASVYLPKNVKSIYADAFKNSSDVVLNVAEGSYAETYAKNNGISYTTRPFIEKMVAEGTCGENATWTLYDSGKIVIGGSGAMDNYAKQSGQPWAEYRDKITSVVIGKDITHVGNYAFGFAHSIKSITFEEGSKLESVGALAFYYILKVTEVELPETVTKIGKLAFAYCDKLTYVLLPQNAKSIYADAFKNSPAVVLDVAEGSYAEDYAKANGISYTTRPFIEKVLVEGTCGENATWTLYEGGKMVIGGSGAMDNYAKQSEQPWAEYRDDITSVVIGKDITHVGNYAFGFAHNIKRITFEEGSKLESVGALAFYYILKATEVELPETVTKIGNLAFAYCGKLTSVYVPEGASVHAQAFKNSPVAQ